MTTTQVAPPPVTVTESAPTVTAPPVTVTSPATVTVTSKQDPTSKSTSAPVSTPIETSTGLVATITTNSGREEDGRTAFTCADVLNAIRPDIGCLPLYQQNWDQIVATNPTGFSDFNGSPDIGWFKGSEASVEDRLYVGLYAYYTFTDAISRYGESQGYRDGLDLFKAEVAKRFPATSENDAIAAYAAASQLLYR